MSNVDTYYWRNKAAKQAYHKARYARLSQNPEWLAAGNAKHRASDARHRQTKKVAEALGISRASARELISKQAAADLQVKAVPLVSVRVSHSHTDQGLQSSQADPEPRRTHSRQP